MTRKYPLPNTRPAPVHMSAKYPFSNWEEFYQVLLSALQKKFGYQSYVEYGEFFYSRGEENDIMLDILSRHPTKEWAQEGLDGLIKVVASGSRLSHLFVSNLKPVVINQMISRGAIIDLSCILRDEQTEDDLEYDEYHAEYLEDFEKYLKDSEYDEYDSGFDEYESEYDETSCRESLRLFFEKIGREEMLSVSY